MSAVPASPPALYVCPGERHAISRSVHWGRLASFYEKCRDCPHRDDTGLLPHAIITAWRATPHAARQPLEFTSDGVRGRYLNDFDRQRAFAWATSYAAWLWDQRPLVGRLKDEAVLGGMLTALGEHGVTDEKTCPPKVAGMPHRHSASRSLVVGYDERPSSPELAVGVVTALRQMGCHAIDIGLATKPIWRFAAREFAADGGLFVTGAGCDPAWTGMDFVGPNGLAFDYVAEIATRLDPLPVRPTRAAGMVESQAIFATYESRLPIWFHALRPLSVVCATPLAILRDLLPRVFAGLPCRLTCLPWPRQRLTESAMPHGGNRLSAAMREQAADVGFLIDEDGQSCTVFDNHGNAVPRTQWQPWLRACVPGDTTGDGVVMLGALLQALSLSDAPLSERLRDREAASVDR